MAVFRVFGEKPEKWLKMAKNGGPGGVRSGGPGDPKNRVFSRYKSTLAVQFLSGKISLICL